jgi:predicted CopG family antitoxin
MRKKQIFRRISVTDEVYTRLKQDREHFQELIGGGRWSISDVITEYLKICNSCAKSRKKTIGKK